MGKRSQRAEERSEQGGGRGVLQLGTHPKSTRTNLARAVPARAKPARAASGVPARAGPARAVAGQASEPLFQACV